MRIPATPPSFVDLLAELTTDPTRFARIARAVDAPSVRQKYLHWDKLRHYDPPAGLSHHEWWLGIKLHRHGRRLPLMDKAGNPFQFNLADPLPEYLHEIDLSTGGNIPLPDQVTNVETRNSYIARSLIEESFTSSQLEGAASTREIAKDLIRQQRSPRSRGERMILNNFRTMQRIIEVKDQPLSQDLVFEIHRLVTEDTIDEPEGAGQFRTEAEHRIVGDEYGNVFHDPPRAAQLPARLNAMCDFANETASEPFLHPAIRAMILHFWLAYDHPFVDGNGRTARALFYWSMLRQGYWLFEFLSISHAILKSSVAYGKAFLHSETDDNDLTYFLIYHTAVVRKAVRDLNEYIEGRSKELKDLEANLYGFDFLNHRQKELIRHALRHPGVRYTVESHRTSHGVSRQTSNNDLNELVDRGLLRRIKAGREHQFIAPPNLASRLAHPQ